MEILFLPVHICISTCLKIQKFRRHHRTLCDDDGMVAKDNQAESHTIKSDTMYIRNHIVFARGVFLVTRQADDQETLAVVSDKYINLYK